MRNERLLVISHEPTTICAAIIANRNIHQISHSEGLLAMIDPVPDPSILSSISKAIMGPLSFIWFIGLALIGGTVNFISKLKTREIKKFRLIELIGEWLISGFAAVLTAYLCLVGAFYLEINPEITWYITAFACGVAGHLGAGAIALFEKLFSSYLNKNTPTGKK